LEGAKPVVAKAIEKTTRKEELTTLRVMVVKSVLSKKDLDTMEHSPSYAMKLLEVDQITQELRTSGWSEQSEAFVGYIEVKHEESQLDLLCSGRNGVFVS